MCTRSLRYYRQLIDCMPAEAQTTVAKIALWQSQPDPDLQAVVRQFITNHGGQTIEISRKNLFDLAATKHGVSKKLIYAVYIWGYPTGGRGGNRQRVVDGICKIENILGETPQNMCEADVQQLHAKLQGHGVGVSTWTKLLYFLSRKVDGHRALILDNKVIRAFERRVFKEFDDIADYPLTYQNAPTHYGDYLRKMSQVASGLEIASDKLETFLFTFGSSLKRRW